MPNKDNHNIYKVEQQSEAVVSLYNTTQQNKSNKNNITDSAVTQSQQQSAWCDICTSLVSKADVQRRKA